jgi:YfiH family protein
MLNPVKAQNLTFNDGFTHGFFTRQGGVSEGLYKSLNTGRGSKDQSSKVAENRARIRRFMGADASCSLSQIHSAKVVEVTVPWVPADMPEADAMVTNRENIALGILTADCVPILLADSDAGIIGAAHAGWKGALGGVVENTVAAMEKLGAEASHIVAAIGPAIEQTSYQVDPLFRERFLKEDESVERFFQKDGSRASHFLFNLKAYVKDRCQRAGVSNIEILKEDTYQLEDQFYSYRRSCHRAEPDYGRQISAIMLKG